MTAPLSLSDALDVLAQETTASIAGGQVPGYDDAVAALALVPALRDALTQRATLAAFARALIDGGDGSTWCANEDAHDEAERYGLIVPAPCDPESEFACGEKPCPGNCGWTTFVPWLAAHAPEGDKP